MCSPSHQLNMKKTTKPKDKLHRKNMKDTHCNTGGTSNVGSHKGK